MDLSQAVGTTGVILVGVMGLAIVVLAAANLAVMLRSGQLPRSWVIVVTAYEVGVSTMVGGIEVDLYHGPGMVRGFIYASAFTVLLVGLSVQARIVGNQADRDRREAAILRQRIGQLKTDRRGR
jgi:hypothetical protein